MLSELENGIILECIDLRVKLKLAKHEAGEVFGLIGNNLGQDMRKSLTEDRNPLYLTSERTSPTMLSGQEYQENLGYEKEGAMVLTNGSLQKLLRNQNLRNGKNGKNNSFDIGGDLDLGNLVTAEHSLLFWKKRSANDAKNTISCTPWSQELGQNYPK